MERKFYTYLAFILTIAIAVVSLINTNEIIIKHVSFSDKALHAFAYCLLTISWLLAVFKREGKGEFNFRVAFFILIYGIIIEVLQETLTNYREADLYDVLANLGGIIVAMIFFKIVLQKNK